jgi:transposase
LPPYSPELNAIEQVWQWLRQNKLANRVLEAMKILLMNAVELGVFSYLMPLE